MVATREGTHSRRQSGWEAVPPLVMVKYHREKASQPPPGTSIPRQPCCEQSTSCRAFPVPDTGARSLFLPNPPMVSILHV